MKILITGGTGFIGSALCAKLLQDGHCVNVLTRRTHPVRDVLPNNLLYVYWNGRSPIGWEHLIEETDAVINLSGESLAGKALPEIIARRWTNEYKIRIQQSRTDGGQALIAAIRAAKTKPRCFIQASAVGYYGSRENEDIPEITRAGNDFLSKVCLAWENSTLDIERMGIRRVIIRTGLVLASKDGILPIMLLPFRMFAGGPIGSGKQVVSWIHLQDQVDAIRFLIKSGEAHGAYNLSAPNAVTNSEFASIASRLLRRPNWMPVPAFTLRIALGEKASIVLEGQRAVPRRLLEAGYHFKFNTLDSALRDVLQIHPRPTTHL